MKIYMVSLFHRATINKPHITDTVLRAKLRLIVEGVGLCVYSAYLKAVTHWKVFFRKSLAKVTCERNLQEHSVI